MAESFQIVDPVSGEPLYAQATLQNCYMLIASQIFTYSFSRPGPQHTDFLKEPWVLDCQSYGIAVAMKTNAQASNTDKGQVHQIDVIGTPHGGGSSKTS